MSARLLLHSLTFGALPRSRLSPRRREVRRNFPPRPCLWRVFGCEASCLPSLAAPGPRRWWPGRALAPLPRFVGGCLRRHAALGARGRRPTRNRNHAHPRRLVASQAPSRPDRAAAARPAPRQAGAEAFASFNVSPQAQAVLTKTRARDPTTGMVDRQGEGSLLRH
jgi:hypothetical protein